jgi:ParB family transcriptional regulator, chromosome partitioning protein
VGIRNPSTMDPQVVRKIPLAKVVCRQQVRQEFPQDEDDGLTASIKEHGVLQPILVRWEGDDAVVVDGERRVRGGRRAGLETIPGIAVPASLTAAELLLWQILANVQRRDLSPMEKAEAIQRLMVEGKLSAAEASAKLSLSPASVSRLLALLTLPAAVQAKVRSGEVPASTAYEIARSGTATEQERLATEVVERGLTRDGVSGRNRKRRGASGEATDGGAPARVTVRLVRGRSVTLAGAGLSTLEQLVEWLEELLGKARKARPRGVELATFVALMKDEARAGGAS